MIITYLTSRNDVWNDSSLLYILRMTEYFTKNVTRHPSSPTADALHWSALFIHPLFAILGIIIVVARFTLQVVQLGEVSEPKIRH